MKTGMSVKRGSVLMEFIIVLPIYLALLGMVFLFGDASLHAVNMAASGDRTLAVSHGMSHHGMSWNENTAMNYVKGALSLSSNTQEVASSRYTDNAVVINENASRLTDSSRGVVADHDFEGSWTWLVGSTLYDDYALSPVSRSFVRAWKVFADAAKMSDPDWEKDREYADDSALKQLFPQRASQSYTLGRIKGMVSKDLEGDGSSVGTYAYYTLMRNGKGRKSYRSWVSANEVGGLLSEGGKVWESYVYKEPYFFNGTRSHSSLVNDDAGAEEASCSSRAPYGRHYDFKKWSR